MFSFPFPPALLPPFLFLQYHFPTSSFFYLTSHLPLPSTLFPTFIFLLSYFPPSSFSYLTSHLHLSSCLTSHPPLFPSLLLTYHFLLLYFPFCLTSNLPLSSTLLLTFLFLRPYLPASSFSYLLLRYHFPFPPPSSFFNLQSLFFYPYIPFPLSCALLHCSPVFRPLILYFSIPQVLRFVSLLKMVKIQKPFNDLNWWLVKIERSLTLFDFKLFHLFFLLMFSPRRVFSSCFNLLLLFYFTFFLQNLD